MMQGSSDRDSTQGSGDAHVLAADGQESAPNPNPELPPEAQREHDFRQHRKLGTIRDLPIEFLSVHPLSSKLPEPSEADRQALESSIGKDGIRVPLDVLPNYQILAGHTRFKIAKRLGLATVPARVVSIPEEKQLEYMVTDNAARRQLTTRQRQQMVALLLEARAVRPDAPPSLGREERKEIASKTHTSTKTVGEVYKAQRDSPEAFRAIKEGTTRSPTEIMAEDKRGRHILALGERLLELLTPPVPEVPYWGSLVLLQGKIGDFLVSKGVQRYDDAPWEVGGLDQMLAIVLERIERGDYDDAAISKILLSVSSIAKSRGITIGGASNGPE